jgi:IclR family KDG regulon transcriptional repressor
VSKKSPCNTLAKGLTILEVVADISDERGVNFNTIVESSRMNRSNVYRYLMTLLELGWVERDEETMRYSIGSRLLQTASRSVQKFDLRSRAVPILQELSEETRKTVHLAVFEPPLIVYVEKIVYKPLPIMQSRPGLTGHCHSTAVGKAMLATMSEHAIREILPESLESYTPATIISLDDLLEELAEARQLGYTHEFEENEIGVGCVGAPVFDYAGKIIAGISVSGAIGDINRQSVPILGQKVIGAARRVSEVMGFRSTALVEQLNC